MTRKINVGIIGLGRSGWDIHSQLLAALPAYYQVVAVCDLDAQRQEEARQRFGCRTYAEAEALLGDPDVELVTVASPSAWHAPHTIQALRAGKAVVCDKPMAPTLAEADEMIRVARETGLPLTIFHQRRYMPEFLKIKQVIASGVLGRILMIKSTWHSFGRRWDWQTLRRLGGGTLNNTAAHFVDLVLQLMGDVEPEVQCWAENVLSLGDAEDHVKIILSAPGAPLADIEITSACAYAQEPWLVMGSRGTLTGDVKALRWKYGVPDEWPVRELITTPLPDRSYPRDEIPWHEGAWALPVGPQPDGLSANGWEGFYLDLHKTLSEGAPLIITPESVRRTMRVLALCHALAGV